MESIQVAVSKVTAREWRWVGLAALLVMALTVIPYLLALSNSTAEFQYGGFLIGVDDMHTYIAEMRYGVRAGWLTELIYTSEPHQGALVRTAQLGLGKLVALLVGGTPTTQQLVIAYHIARLLFGWLLLLVSYLFIAEFIAAVAPRRLAWTLVATGGGLGWLVLAVFGSDWLGTLPIEFNIPEAFTFLSLFSWPHLTLARTLLLLGWLALLKGVNRESWWLAALAGLLWLLMGTIIFFYIALTDMLIGAWLAALWLRNRKVPLQAAMLAAIAGLISGLALFYNLWVFTNNPIFVAWASQGIVRSPHPLHYAAGYGLLVLLALWAMCSIWIDRPVKGPLLVGWIAIAPLLVYLPVNIQRRMTESVILPLSILGVLGLQRLTENWQSGRRLLAQAGLLTLLLPSSLVILLIGFSGASSPRWPLYHSGDELAMLTWLEQHALPDSVVVSSSEQGNVLPAYADVRVYVGHSVETVDSSHKAQQALDFFGDGMTDTQRLSLLDEGRVTYVLVGPQETFVCPATSSTCFVPEELGLQFVFEQGPYTIYRVAP